MPYICFATEECPHYRKFSDEGAIEMSITIISVHHPDSGELVGIELHMGDRVYMQDAKESKLRLGHFPCRSYGDVPEWERHEAFRGRV